MLLIRRTLWQWHPSPSVFTTRVLLRRYHRPCSATVFYPPNLTDDLAPLRTLTPPKPDQLPPTPHHSLLLLATPLLAPSLSNDRQWLITLLNQLYKNIPKLKLSIRVGVAVVDALPVPKQLCWNDHWPYPSPLLPRSGLDGFAYLLNDWSMFKGFSPVEPTGNKTATVSLTLQHPHQHYNYAYDVHIPLANTTFVVGQDVVSMVVDFKKSSGQPFRETSSIDTQNITISWPYPVVDRGPYDGRFTLSAPLLPLTVPRKILASMGNVIRQISGSETDTLGIPASSELEAAVTSFFQATGLPQTPISVWALVTPSEIDKSQNASVPHMWHTAPESLQAHWRTFVSTPNRDFLPYLKQGARLHRVLSGGGGWGQKAGLLALDPSTNFAGDENDQPSHFPSDPDSTSYEAVVLGDVARVGDYIQFFISCTEESKAQHNLTFRPSRSWSLRIGTIPSTIDQLPSERYVKL
jgi:hypothetical protein